MSWIHHTPSRRGVLAASAGLIAGAAVPVTRAAAGTVRQQEQFTNPVIWQDFADVDIIRVGDTFYYTASTMHYSPGAPILRSYDLANWEFAGHAVPVLDFGAKYDLDGGQAYIDGIWASSLGYRPSEEKFYWVGQTDFAQTHVYTASAAEGPWSRHATIPSVYYDAGLLFDEDDTPYVAYGNTTISVAQLSADASSQVSAQEVFSTPSDIGTLEGSRFYKINGNYYIFLTRPANGQYILKSSSPFGPYELRELLLDLPGPIEGAGVPHQGGLVDTPNGDWYYMAFIDAYPCGRIPTLAPITWTDDGWPELQLVDGAWGTNYPYPLPPVEVEPLTGVDTFEGESLKPAWEWNHNPDTSRFTVDNGLTLQTATVTDDLYAARNTLTHRIQGPTSTATIELNYAGMADGDRAGLAILRDASAWIGVTRDAGASRVVMVDGLTMDVNNDWNTSGTGTEQDGADLPADTDRIWLRAAADVTPGFTNGTPGTVTFAYSTDGTTFTDLGPAFSLHTDWQFFMSNRYAIFNHATQALGGSVTVARFELATP
jgi:beta-xylosidase